jgi:hypothetical protein
MNDFTTDELHHIHKLFELVKLAYPSYLLNESIENKIQALIDNYCEHNCHHEWDGTLITTKPNTGKCKKCGQVCYIAIKDVK